MWTHAAELEERGAVPVPSRLQFVLKVNLTSVCVAVCVCEGVCPLLQRVAVVQAQPGHVRVVVFVAAVPRLVLAVASQHHLLHRQRGTVRRQALQPLADHGHHGT